MSTSSATRNAQDIQQLHTKQRSKKGLARERREWIAAYLFLAPDALGLLVFVGIPMIYALALGFFDVDGFGNFSFAGLMNYSKMFSDPQFLISLRVTLVYVIVLVPGLFVAGLGLALLVKQRIPFIGLFRSMFFMPYVISLVVVGFVWKFMLTDQIGVFNQFLTTLGLNSRSWLGDPNLALGTVIFINIWLGMGYYMIIFLAGLQDIPHEYYEAAYLDGASGWNAFRYVTWPLLKPTSFFVLLVSLVSAVAGSQGFDLIYVMTRGGPDQSTSLGIFYIYQQAFQFGHYGYAAAMASALVAVLLIATLILFALTKGGRFEFD
ncbi:sugar ABC transporter permease [Ktedonosporobacter rubrisoli]|uniref:Sugar ABC transporter permease n=1 Tax=Ktedonosporobacter rubrisoli TaxID=2509675 RepID=A0A4P6JT07_KTERU|nr:sugar ABC transporter permease [Ktedonosporobacter rubrisoli]QBD78698.1 sugar ABC transporter permease [Ktedonosporobacter rubrisoli]